MGKKVLDCPEMLSNVKYYDGIIGKNSSLCWAASDLAGTSSPDPDVAVHEPKGACGLMWLTALKEIARLHLET